jgi:hypothetical protein
MRRSEVESALGLSVDYELPSTQEVCAAVNRGRPLTLEAPSSEFSLAVRAMSHSLLGLDGRAAATEPAEQQPARADFVNTVRGLTVGWRRSRGPTAESAEEPT